jgi:hypothetical protein
MRVRIIVGAEAAYASIQTSGAFMDVRLEPGRSAAQSLRETAEEWRDRAAKLQQRAMFITEAAAQLEEDEKAGRQYATRHG